MRDLYYGAIIGIQKTQPALATADGAVLVCLSENENEYFWRSILIHSVPIDKASTIKVSILSEEYPMLFSNFKKWNILKDRYPELRRCNYTKVNELYGQDIWN